MNEEVVYIVFNAWHSAIGIILYLRSEDQDASLILYLPFVWFERVIIIYHLNVIIWKRDL